MHSRSTMKKLTKNLLTILTAAVLCLPFLIPVSPSAKTAVRTVNNIVLFAQFGHDDNFMTAERTELLRNGLCETDTVNSLYGYINAISYGQMQTACYFPQLVNDTIQPYTLTQKLEDYSSKSLALEVICNVSIPESIPLDGDNDGCIDNFILVVDGKADSQQDVLWPHQSTLANADVRIHGKTVDYYNMHNSCYLFDSSSFELPVICHEFLHSIGYPDLYRGTGGLNTGTPVGMWDIMAGSSSLNYPLAYMRASRSGWLETVDITENGTYTLVPASASSGNRVYLLKTPASATEFFAVEFRQSGKTLYDLDGYCPTGMLVYRVDTRKTGNRYDGDEIYLFRPTDSNLIGQANYGGKGRDDFIGSLNLEDGLEDGALTFSDGTNSGIRIENITIDGDTLTFDVQFAETDRQKIWHSVPNATALNQSDRHDLAVSDSGTVYLARITENGKAVSLYRLSETVSEHVSDLTVSGDIFNVKLAIAGETPYLLCQNRDGSLVLYTCDPASGEWQILWQNESSFLSENATDITAKGSEVYIGCIDTKSILQVFRYADNSMTRLGDIVSESISLSLACTDETVVVVYCDSTDNFLPKLALWEEENWTRITLADTPSSILSAVSDGKTITTATSAGLYHYKNSTLSCTEYPVLPSEPFYIYPLYVDGTLMTAIYTQGEFQYALYAYHDGWEICGNYIEESQSIYCPVIVVSGNVIYTAYKLNGASINGVANPLLLKVLQYYSVSGDVNADGNFNVLDIVCMQKWLLGIEQPLSDWKTGDFDKNGSLDIFDLALMKRALINVLSF